ncbi:MAG: ATP-dependent DNA helicase RecG, partial [Clostridia bacterium]|nr:ATP-dependent DNA helicase RecG [Clostridia bacterium]
FFGARQHGLPQMKLADLLTDTKELAAASAAASAVLDTDYALQKPEHKGLAQAVHRLINQVGQG